MSLQTPVLFLVFNRPTHTAEVFARIRAVKPRFLFVAADGPRSAISGEEQKCREVRETITSQIDWECELKTLFRERNLGCGLAVSSALDWFFNQVEEGIVLEDDTLPSVSFFNFCSEMLQHYRNDDQVMHVGGSSFLFGRFANEGSYYFSRYPIIWGWATWQRAWKHYQYNFHDQFNDKIIQANSQSKREAKYWDKAFNTFLKGECDTWDYSWNFAVWKAAGLSILPTTNLVKNIGIGLESTHTRAFKSKYSENLENDLGQIILKSDKRLLLDADKLYFNEFVKPDRISFANLMRNNASKLLGAENYERLKRGKNQLLKILQSR